MIEYASHTIKERPKNLLLNAPPDFAFPPSHLLNAIPTIHDQRLASDPAHIITRQHNSSTCGVLWLAHAAERMRLVYFCLSVGTVLVVLCHGRAENCVLHLSEQTVATRIYSVIPRTTMTEGEQHGKFLVPWDKAANNTKIKAYGRLTARADAIAVDTIRGVV